MKNINAKNGFSAYIAIFIVLIALLTIGIIVTIVSKNSTHDSDITNTANLTNTNNSENIENQNSTFLMAIEDVFSIEVDEYTSKTVVTGKVERGSIKKGDTVEIVGLSDNIITTTVNGIEMFRKEKEEANVGENVGIVLKNVSRDEVERGQVLAKPGSIKSHTQFEANVYVLTKEEKGKGVSLTDSEKGNFYFRTLEDQGKIEILNGSKRIDLGDSAKIKVKVEKGFAMEVGTEFIIRDNNKKNIANGKVTKVY